MKFEKLYTPNFLKYMRIIYSDTAICCTPNVLMSFVTHKYNTTYRYYDIARQP